MPDPAENRRGSLVIVGSGIRILGQLTVEAIARIKGADKVLHIVSDPIAEAVLERLNPGRSETLAGYYAAGKPRIDSYHEMVDRVLECVRSGLKVCVVTYGHPGIFAYPTHESIRRAPLRRVRCPDGPRDLGGGLPVRGTWASTRRPSDACPSKRPISSCTGTASTRPAWSSSGRSASSACSTSLSDGPELFALPLLVERLSESYPADHPVIIYQGDDRARNSLPSSRPCRSATCPSPRSGPCRRSASPRPARRSSIARWSAASRPSASRSGPPDPILAGRPPGSSNEGPRGGPILVRPRRLIRKSRSTARAVAGLRGRGRRESGRASCGRAWSRNQIRSHSSPAWRRFSESTSNSSTRLGL